MSEQIHDQVSAFMDDELSAEECAFLVRRLERDPEARSKLAHYSLIGTTLRGELLQPNPQLLRNRLNAALNGTAAPADAPAAAAAAHGQRAGSGQGWANPAVGLGIAASVAVAALFTVRALNEVGDGAEAAAASAAFVPAYVVPADGQESGVISASPPIRLTNYLLHHGEYAHRLSRTSVHSNVVGGMDVPSVPADSAVAPGVTDDQPPAQNELEAR